MTSRTLRLLSIFWMVIVLTLGGTTVARAQKPAQPEVTFTAGQTTAEVGDRVFLTFTITTEEPLGAFSPPTLDVPSGLSSQFPTVSTATSTRIVNGERTTRSIVRVTYPVVGARAGKYTVKAPRAIAGGRTLTAPDVAIEIVAPGGGAGGTGGLFLGPITSFDFDDLKGRDDEESATSRELAMATGPDDVVFLRAIPDKEAAFVGEQLTLSVYLYYRVGYEMTDRTDAKYTDFLRYPLLANPGTTEPVYTRVSGKRYGARLVERVALIPLRTGKLSTGVMAARFRGREIGSKVLRTSNDVVIDVKEPPIDGRPAGYVVGDVGQFSLSAVVAPRKIEQGGSIGISLKVEGAGNFPSRLTVPSKVGIEFLEPRRRDAIAPKKGLVAGSRTFDYVVRMKNSGENDLGTVELVYFDPQSKSYETASVSLGKVEVEEVAPTKSEIDRAQSKTASSGEDLLGALPKPRTTLAAFQPPRSTQFTLEWLVGLLVAPPALALLWIGLARTRKMIERRRGTAAASARTRVNEALSDAKGAEKRGEARGTAAAAERAVHEAISARIGVKSRGLRLAEVAPALVRGGLSAAVAEEAAAILQLCEEQRFLPEPDAAVLGGVTRRARKLVQELKA